MNRFLVTLKDDEVFFIETKMDSLDIMKGLTQNEYWINLEGNIVRIEDIQYILKDNN